MTVEELRVFLYAIANKDQSGDLPSPEQYNSFLARAVEQKFIAEYGLRNVGTNMFYQNSQASTDALGMFLTATVITQLTPGIFTLPPNYVHVSSMGCDYQGKRRMITLINDDEWNNRLDSVLTPATDKYPIARMVSAGSQIILSVAPGTVTQVYFNYLRKPITPVWGYTIVNDEPVYNPATSVQIEFAPIYHLDIAKIILSYMGIEFKDDMLLQWSEMTKAQGQ